MSNILPLLDSLDEKASKASPPTWIHESAGWVRSDPECGLEVYGTLPQSENDADFIVALVNAYPSLSSELRRAMRKNQELVIWIADYTYRKCNPDSKMDTPSIVYEQVEKDFNAWLNS